MKYFIAVFFFVPLILFASLNEPVPASYEGYSILLKLKNLGLLGDKSYLFQKGIILTRREFATLSAVGLSELENRSKEEIKSLDPELLRDFEKMCTEFSEELQNLYSFDIDTLTKKISFLEESIKLAKQGSPIFPKTKTASTKTENMATSDGNNKKIENRYDIPKNQILMKYDPNNPVLNENTSINFISSPINKVIATLFKGTGLSVVTSGDMKEKVTIQVEDKPIIDVLKSLAKSNRFDFEVKNGIVTITPLKSEKTEILELKYANADEVKPLLDSFKGSRGNIKTDKRTNSLIVTDSIENIRKIKTMLSKLDIENSKTKKVLKVFTLQYTNPKSVEGILNTLKSPKGIIQVNNDNNSLIINDFQENVELMTNYLKILDQPIESKQINTEVYNVRYAKAQDIQTILESDVFKNKKTSLKITNDSRTNSLVISGYPSDIRMIKRYIKKLDARNRQVVIAAKIIEITLDKNHSEGINWSKLMPRNNTEKDVSNDNILSTNLFDTSTNSYTLSFKFGTLDNEQFNAVLQALKNNSKVKVVSNPTITTLNNQEAKILIGEKIPFEETTTSTTGTSTKVDFQDVGIKLTVTPSISSDNYVTLKIHPEISQQKGVVQATGKPIIGSTEADTSILVRNTDTLVIGGLVKETTSNVSNKIPILGDIPGLGRAFQFNKVEKNRTETIIFITPTIVNYEEGDPYEISEYYK